MATINKGGGVPGTGDFLQDVNSQKQAKVALANPLVPEELGMVGLASLNDLGTITGIRQIRMPRTSLDERLTVGVINKLDSDIFNYTAQHTGKYNLTAATMTATFASNGLNLNSGALVTASTGIYHNTRVLFNLPSEGGLSHEHLVQLNAVGATNTEILIGRFQPSPTASAIPLDGVYCRVTSAGVTLVTNNNGSENTTSPLIQFTPSINTVFKVKLIENNRQAELYINDILYCVGVASSGISNLTSNPNLPICHQIRITATPASVGTIVKIGGWAIWSNDVLNIKNAELTAALNGGVGQGQQGSTMGAISRYVNNTNQTPAVPNNTTAALGVGLGGEFWETDTLAVTTDGIIQSYQNPLSTINIIGKTLIIKGITISSFVQTALTGGGYNAIFTLNWGHTSVNLTSTETATTKARRVKTLKSYLVPANAAVLTQLPDVYINFQNPIVVNPGEFISISKKKIGTAPTAGVIVHAIDFDHLFID